MIVKIVLRGNSKDMADYALKKGKWEENDNESSRIMAITNCGFCGTDVELVYKAFDAMDKTASRAKHGMPTDHLVHFTMRCADGESEKLTEEIRMDMFNIFLKMHNLEEHQNVLWEDTKKLTETKKLDDHWHGCVCRVHPETLIVNDMAFFKRKNCAVSRIIERKYGLQVVIDPFVEMGLEERGNVPDWAWKREHQKNPNIIAEELCILWEGSRNGGEFVIALEEEGYLLTKGDIVGKDGRPVFVVIDNEGNMHSLGKCLNPLGLTADQRSEFMKDIDVNGLYSVADGKTLQKAAAYNLAVSEGREIYNEKIFTAQVVDVYNHAENGEQVKAGLEALGYVLAKGDKDGVFLAVDKDGHFVSITRKVEDKKAQVIEKFSDLDRATLPDMEKAKAFAQELNGIDITVEENQHKKNRDFISEAKRTAKNMPELIKALEKGGLTVTAIRDNDLMYMQKQRQFGRYVPECFDRDIVAITENDHVYRVTGDEKKEKAWMAGESLQALTNEQRQSAETSYQAWIKGKDKTKNTFSFEEYVSFVQDKYKNNHENLDFKDFENSGLKSFADEMKQRRQQRLDDMSDATLSETAKELRGIVKDAEGKKLVSELADNGFFVAKKDNQFVAASRWGSTISLNETNLGIISEEIKERLKDADAISQSEASEKARQYQNNVGLLRAAVKGLEREQTHEQLKAISQKTECKPLNYGEALADRGFFLFEKDGKPLVMDQNGSVVRYDAKNIGVTQNKADSILQEKPLDSFAEAKKKSELHAQKERKAEEKQQAKQEVIKPFSKTSQAERTVKSSILVVSKASNIAVGLMSVVDSLLDVVMPTPKVTYQDYLGGGKMRQEFFSVKAKLAARDQALENMQEDRAKGRHLAREDISSLTREDLENLKSKGDAYLIGLIEERERENKKAMERRREGRERER